MWSLQVSIPNGLHRLFRRSQKAYAEICDGSCFNPEWASQAISPEHGPYKAKNGGEVSIPNGLHRLFRLAARETGDRPSQGFNPEWASQAISPIRWRYKRSTKNGSFNPEWASQAISPALIQRFNVEGEMFQSRMGFTGYFALTKGAHQQRG